MPDKESSCPPHNFVEALKPYVNIAVWICTKCGETKVLSNYDTRK